MDWVCGIKDKYGKVESDPCGNPMVLITNRNV
jgi:hypothetical protein